MFSKRTIGIVLALSLGVSGVGISQEDGSSHSPIGAVLGRIAELEGRSDPKCYATAARLEDFLFGTPLTEEARILKNQLLKVFVRTVWEAASGESLKLVNRSSAAQEIAMWLSEKEEGEGVTVITRSGRRINLTQVDLRHYKSIAYSLRAILATQQEALFRKPRLAALDESAFQSIEGAVDFVGLSVLQVADKRARTRKASEVGSEDVQGAWRDLFGEKGTGSGTKTEFGPVPDGQPLLRRIAQQKLQSYAKYNGIANQLFVRNLQVYFARLSWPKDPVEAKAFRQAFTETVIAFAADLYRHAGTAARKGKKPVIGEAEVAGSGQAFLPHVVNEYEDVTFFPRLDPKDQVTIEAYDFDAFRDSGIHWRYLSAALDDLARENLPDADPFAAELLAEYVAQFGVLILRSAGNEGKRRDEERLSVSLLGSGLRGIQKSIEANGARKEVVKPPARIASAGAKAKGEIRFQDCTEASGVLFMNRSSDWLSRLLRSYLPKGNGAGEITIPPAFGGSGVGAGDLNGDGDLDLLLLSGSGNRVYLGNGQGGFRDITASSGLVHLRPLDRAPGEPRQPLIADFNNDGKQDILITYVDEDHRLYRGNGDGTFVDVTAACGLGGAGLVGGPATTFDFDRDGLLDIYISYFGDFVRGVLPTLKRRNDNGLPNRLFRNVGGMRFEDVTGRAGVGDSGWGQAAFHTDFDGDGWQDLISGNDFGVNRYYRNKGDGTFEEVSTELGTGKPSYTMSLSASDLNRDMLPDIYVSNIVTMNKDEGYVLPNEDTRMKFDLKKLANMRVVEANDLFLSRRDNNKTAVKYSLSKVVERGYSSTGWSWDADFFDADLDGDDDLYVLNGLNEFNLYSSRDPYFMNADKSKSKEVFIPVAPKEANVFFENETGKLRIPARPSGLEFVGNSRSAVFLDWDEDGDLDVCVNNFGERATMLRNETESAERNWIKLKLVGDPAKGINRDAIGSRVVFRLPDGKTIWREVHGSTGYMSVHPKTVHAGLGGAKKVEVQVRWPNGVVEEFGEFRANGAHTIRADAKQAK